MTFDYPKWVTPHDSHVVRTHAGRPLTPLWPEHHVDRNGAITVLVHSKDEEDRAVLSHGRVDEIDREFAEKYPIDPPEATCDVN